MIRLILNIVGLYCFCCIFSLFSTGVIGEPIKPCGGNFNETFNISDTQLCDKYYVCSEETKLPTAFSCGKGLRFSPESEECIDAKRVNCSETGRTFNPQPLINPDSCKIEDGKFLCRYGKECLDIMQLCDGNLDCLDASDEFENCASVCANPARCAHTCIPTPPTSDSPAGTCLCMPGYLISTEDKTKCVDMNECETFGSCSQHCINLDGSFECSCMEGFQLGRNNRSCDPIDPKWKLVYSTRTEVGYISKSSSGNERKVQLTHNEGRPVAVTYDARNNVTYWTDATSFSETIYRGSLNGDSKIEAVVDTGLLLPEGIAFDWITGNIYFADSNYSHIVVCRNDTSICAVLVQEAIDKPRDIALHPNIGIMFWTDWGITPAIMRAGMDGSFPLAIVSTNLKWPNGITVDQGNGRIYWVDAGLDRIESSLFDGSSRQLVISRDAKHPFGVDVLGDRLFWSDWSSHEIKSANKYNGTSTKVHLLDPHTLMNGLAMGSHLFTLTPGATRSRDQFRCFCPAGMVLDNDKKTCVEPKDLPKLVIAFKGTLKTMRFNTIGKNIFDSLSLPQIKSISAIVYNPINHTFILSDAASKKIYEYNINRQRLSVLIDQHLDTVKGMDIDVVGENLYWVDSGKRTVEAMSFRTSARTIIMNGVENPYDILVVPELGSLYLARIGKRGGKIYKMFLTGYSNSVIQRVGNKEPIALALDKEFGSILWADKVYRGIESISFDGKSNSRIVVKQDGPPSDVVKFENQVYWTDMFSEDLKVVNVGSQSARLIKIGTFEGNSTSSSNSTNFLAKMTIVNHDLSNLDELRSKHDCSMKNPNRKACSDICLLTGDAFSGLCRCPDGLTLDEDGLTCIKLSTCNQDQYTCNDGNCISKNYVCDGTPDCSNHDDEVNCNQSTCMEGNYKCESNGVCIPDHWICDGESDCINGDDERNCTFVPCNEDMDFRCESTGRCIPKYWRCDNAFDCPDERGCNFTCPEGFFQCANTQHCIVFDWVCDKEKDCEDGSDETANCDHKACEPDQFTCKSGLCIEDKLKCDGWSNCAQNEDEENCEPFTGHGDHRSENSNNITVLPAAPIEKDDTGSGSTVAIVLGVVVIIVLVAIIIALVLHKRNIQPKVLVRPYVQQWNRYINEPARRLFTDSRGQQKLDCEQNVYDEVYAGGSATYYNNAVYEEVDGAANLEPPSSPEKRLQRDAASRSFADSGILNSERESLYEEAEDCGSHYVSYSQKDKLIAS